MFGDPGAEGITASCPSSLPALPRPKRKTKVPTQNKTPAEEGNNQNPKTESS